MFVWIEVCGSVYSAKQQEPHESAFSNNNKKKNTLSDKLIKPQSLPDPGRRYSTGEVSGVATIFVGFRSMTWTLLFLQKEIRFLSSDTTVCLHFQSPQL